jgi:hypothetical protein
MTGRRITAGLSVLCALVFCAFSASSASAAGTTAFECVSGGGLKDFSDADCGTFVGAGNGEYGHVALTPKTLTKVELNGGEAKLMGTIFGITTTLVATGFKSKASTSENTEENGAMVIKGKVEGEFTGVTVAEGPPGCEVKGKVIENAKMTSTTKEMEVKFTAAPTFGEFVFENCNILALNSRYKIIGTATGIPNGANLGFTEVSTSSLKFAGQAAFLVTTLTEKMEGGNALSPTTTTP